MKNIFPLMVSLMIFEIASFSRLSFAKTNSNPAIVAKCTLHTNDQNQSFDFYSLLNKKQNISIKYNAYLGFSAVIKEFFIEKDFSYSHAKNPSFNIQYGGKVADAVLEKGSVIKNQASPSSQTAQASFTFEFPFSKFSPEAPSGDPTWSLTCEQTKVPYLLVPKSNEQPTVLDEVTTRSISLAVFWGTDIDFCLIGSSDDLLNDLKVPLLHPQDPSIRDRVSNLHVSPKGAVAWHESYDEIKYPESDRGPQDYTIIATHERDVKISQCRTTPWFMKN